VEKKVTLFCRQKLNDSILVGKRTLKKFDFFGKHSVFFNKCLYFLGLQVIIDDLVAVSVLNILTMIIFAGCRTQQLPPERHETTETVRIEYREILRDTTIYILLPQEQRMIMTRDTKSVLETSLALSVAMVSDGFLHHSIENRDTTLQARIIYRDIHVIRDSIRSEYRDIPFAVPAEFSRWQSFLMRTGLVAFGLIIAIAIGSLTVVSTRIKRR